MARPTREGGPSPALGPIFVIPALKHNVTKQYKFSTNISKYDKYEVSARLTSTVAGLDPLRQSTSSLISSIVNSRLPMVIETLANMNLNISEY